MRTEVFLMTRHRSRHTQKCSQVDPLRCLTQEPRGNPTLDYKSCRAPKPSLPSKAVAKDPLAGTRHWTTSKSGPRPMGVTRRDMDGDTLTNKGAEAHQRAAAQG